MEETALDENLATETNHEYAGFWIRFLASIIDSLVLLPLSVLYLLVLFGINNLALTLTGLLVVSVYKPYMEFKYGATLGKMAVGIKLVGEDGGNISLNQALIRYIPWAIGNVISLFTFIGLHMSPELESASGFAEISGILAQEGNSALSTISSLVYLIAGLSIAFDSKKQGVHDRFAKTYCINK